MDKKAFPFVFVVSARANSFRPKLNKSENRRQIKKYKIVFCGVIL